MTKAEQARIVAWRLRILQHAEGEPRQVARTCRYFGISRTAFYRLKKRFEELGEVGLADRPRTRRVHHYSRHFETEKVTGAFFGFGIICVFGMYAISGLAM